MTDINVPDVESGDKVELRAKNNWWVEGQVEEVRENNSVDDDREYDSISIVPSEWAGWLEDDFMSIAFIDFQSETVEVGWEDLKNNEWDGIKHGTEIGIKEITKIE